MRDLRRRDLRKIAEDFENDTVHEEDLNQNVSNSINIIDNISNSVNIIVSSLQNFVDYVNELNNIDKNVYDELKKITEGDNQFVALGFQSNVCQLLQDCDFMMLFSKHEGLPISLIEANMCGTPVVCNDVGGNAEIVHNGVNGFVVNEWDELVNVLNNLPNMTEEEYKRLSTNGRRLFEDNFTFDQFKKNYCDLIEDIIQKES